jgi:hypothetical protein
VSAAIYRDVRTNDAAIRRLRLVIALDRAMSLVARIAAKRATLPGYGEHGWNPWRWSLSLGREARVRRIIRERLEQALNDAAER